MPEEQQRLRSGERSAKETLTNDWPLAQSLREILVVEDEISIRRLLVLFFRKVLGNSNVEEAESAVEGLRKIEEGHFDFIITDIVMPGKNGIDMLAQTSEKKRRIPALVISGYATDSRDFIERIPRPNHHIQFLQKPFTLPALLEAIEETLRIARDEEAEGGGSDRGEC